MSCRSVSAGGVYTKKLRNRPIQQYVRGIEHYAWKRITAKNATGMAKQKLSMRSMMPP